MSGDVLTQRRKSTEIGVVTQARLGDVCRIDTSISFPCEEEIWLLNLDMIEQQTGRVIQRIYVDRNALGGSTVAFNEHCVLYSKLRPNLNKVVLPDRKGVATSEILPLRCDADHATREFVCWFLRSPTFVSYAMNRTAGAKMPRLGTKALLNAKIPLPPLADQRRIATKLDRLCDIVTKRKQQLVQLQQLVKSRFVEMFGNELEQGRWPSTTVGEVANVCVGVVIKPTQYYQESGIRAFRSLNIGEMVVKDDDWVFFSETGHAKNQKSVVHRNDVLVVRSGAPGTACVVPEHFDGCNAVDIIIARPDCNKVDPTFLAMFTNMPHGKNQIRNQIGGAAQQHYNVGGYKKLQLIAPPLPLQREFAAFVAKVDKLAFAARQRREVAKQLYRAKIQEFFG